MAGIMHTKVIAIVLILSYMVETSVVQLMVGGACGLLGRHVLPHAVVDRPDNVCATTLHPHGVEVTALATVPNNKSVLL